MPEVPSKISGSSAASSPSSLSTFNILLFRTLYFVMADEARIREVAIEVVEPVQALAELLRQEKEDALTKAKTAESKAEASVLGAVKSS